MAAVHAPLPAPTRKPPAGGRSGSDRLRLARLAAHAALRVPGVMNTDAGSARTFATATAEEQVLGVRCTAAAGGGYDVALRLVCALVPLVPLGKAVRRAVLTAAAREGIPVAAVVVQIADVAGPAA